MAPQPQREDRGSDRGRRPPDRLEVDRRPARKDGAEGNGQAAANGERPDQDGHRAGGCHFVHLQGAAALAGGPEGSAPADRLVHLPGPDGRGQDAAGEIAGGIHVQQPRGADPDRHVGIHGEVQRLAPGGLAARLRGLRGRRPAHRARAPPPVFRGAVRRNREGPSGRDAHAAADPGRGAPDGRAGPGRGLPQHHHHHDLEHRVRHRAPRCGAGVCRTYGGGRLREAARADAGGVQAELPARTAEPGGGGHRLPAIAAGGRAHHPGDRSRQGGRPPEVAGDRPVGAAFGVRIPDGQGLRPPIRRAAAPPRRGALAGERAGRGHSARQDRQRRDHRSRSGRRPPGFPSPERRGRGAAAGRRGSARGETRAPDRKRATGAE